MIMCERCEGWTCQDCLGMSDDQYTLATEGLANFHYFCDNCDLTAMTTVQTDADIEEKCKKYCEKLEERIQGIEEVLANQAEKGIVDSLGA